MAIHFKPKPDTDLSLPTDSIKKSSGELGTLLKQFSKDKGEGVWSKANSIPKVDRIPTGVFEFDLATNGGFPKGRLSIVYGPESSGKSNICYKLVASAQKLPENCNKVIWVDLEGTFDPEWIGQFGVNLENLIVLKPGYGEETVDLVDALVRADDVALIVVDSIAVLTSSAEIEKSTEKADVGSASLLVKRLCNKMAHSFSMESKRGHFPSVVFINQTRYKIGVMFGDPETQPGGQTMKFLSSLTVRLYAKNKIIKEIHPDLAAYKETNAVIKKAKVPILAANFSYDMCVYPHNELNPGDTNSWNSVANHLKAANILVKGDKGGWVLEGNHYPTLIPIQDTYESSSEFALKLQKLVIQSKGSKQFLVEEK